MVASYYDLFAVMGGSDSALIIETLVFAGFACLAVIGFRMNAWLVAVGLAAHGLFDFFRGDLIVNPGVPGWWPAFCASFDVVAGGYLAWRLARARSLTPATPG